MADIQKDMREAATPRPFRPQALASGVIALPLQQQIDDELAATQKLKTERPDLSRAYNAAIFLNPAFKGGTTAALDAVRALLPEAVRRAASRSKTDPSPAAATTTAAAVPASVRTRVPPTPPAPPRIDPPDPGVSDRIAPAVLDGATMRQLRGLDARGHAPPAIDRIWPTHFEVIVDINLRFAPLKAAARRMKSPPAEAEHPDPRRVAKALIRKYIAEALRSSGVADPDQGVDGSKTEISNQHVFARLEGAAIKKLVEIDEREAKKMAGKARRMEDTIAARAVGRTGRAVDAAVEAAPEIESSRFRTIHRIWPDFDLRTCINRSIRTVKVDAARNSFTASGEDITWAVMDTGIDALHPHFRLHANIDVLSPWHADFTGTAGEPQPLHDDYGHGTHVAGIIAGAQSVQDKSDPAEMVAVRHEIDVDGATVTKTLPRIDAISGMAPKCRLVSLKVLDEFGMGRASNVIAAIAHVQLINGHGRDLKIHGVNLSLGHTFDPKWFACGHSPLCVEVNRLVRSGVVVVTAAGNTGYGSLQTAEGDADVGLDMTINDPGNAEEAITVGSTHRDMPHRYGVSYFSSKGPTGDGRCKPDLLAPGEKILSCAAAGSELLRREASGTECSYFESSGTSMAAPHVSGAIAAFLSIRREFIGEAQKVKAVFTSTATDLGRDRYFQGAGLVDLMRAIQSV